MDPEQNPDALEKYVTVLIKSLNSYIYTKNRIGLYNKQGIGLGIAIDEHDAENDGAGSEYKLD